MTPSRPRGRPRSEERRDAVLAAAMELIQEDWRVPVTESTRI